MCLHVHMALLELLNDCIQDKIAKDINTHGAMLVPIVSGLDKTTVSAATGQQEFHPFYVSAGNLTNAARRGHGNGVVPVAFLPIPKGALQFYFLLRQPC